MSRTQGFTLIELLVAITITAILSTIGFVSYSQAQVLSRDARRKQDLKAVATALEIYRQKNSTYPYPGQIDDQTKLWYKSGEGDDWLGGADSRGLVAGGYINKMPQDPSQKDPSSCFPWETIGEKCFAYAYFSGTMSGSCTSGKGKLYLLVARLENSNDPEAGNQVKPNGCDLYPATVQPNIYYIANP